jgi:hypothetical protein
MAVPDWLVRVLSEAVGRLGWQHAGWDGEMAVLIDDKGRESNFGLENIERRLEPLPEEERVNRLVQHLRGLQSVRPPSSLAAARERLLVRLRPAFEDDDVSKHVWSAPLGETGLIHVLVIDQPDAMTYVTNDMIEGSGRTGEEWLTFALENLRAVTSSDLLVELDEDTGVAMCGSGDAYDAARALVLDKLFDEPAPLGFILSVPTRDRLLAYPVDENFLDSRFVTLLIATLGMHMKEAYPISDGLFWVHDGEWESIGYEYADEELTAELPPGLQSVLEDEGEE